MPDSRTMGERIVYSQGMSWDLPITKERKMTRTAHIVNTSNGVNEDLEISGSSMYNTIKLRPGEIANIPLHIGGDNLHLEWAGSDEGVHEYWSLTVTKEG